MRRVQKDAGDGTPRTRGRFSTPHPRHASATGPDAKHAFPRRGQPECGCEVFPSACGPKTTWLATNSTLIYVLSFCTRSASSIAPRVACTDNGRFWEGSRVRSALGGQELGCGDTGVPCG